MARLEVRIEGEKVGARKVLTMATLTIKMLRSIEKERTGKRAQTEWFVDIMSSSTYALIAIRSESKDTENINVAFDTAAEMQRRLAGANV